MKAFERLIILLLVITSLVCCHSKSTVDGFYTEKGEWDSGRLPFVKPYEAVITTKEYGWSMNLNGLDGDTGFQNIKKANVVNGIILVYAANTILHGEDVKESWHIIIPGKRIEKGFAGHAEYINTLNKLGIRVEPHLHNIEAIANYYNGHDTIDWQAVK